MTFREKLLITLIGSAIAAGFEEGDTADALEATNEIAKLACRDWGHDWAPFSPYVLTNYGWRPPGAAAEGEPARCRRCGVVYEAGKDPS